MRASVYSHMPEPTVNVYLSGGDENVTAGCFRASLSLEEARTLRDLLTRRVRFANQLLKGRRAGYAAAWEREA